MKRTTLLSSTVAVLFLLPAIPAHAGKTLVYKASDVTSQVPAQVHTKLAAELYNFSVYRIDAPSVRAFVSMNDRSSVLELKLGSAYSWALSLEAHDLRAPGFSITVAAENGKVEAPQFENFTYKGYANGNPDNTVRIAIRDNYIAGSINDNGTGYYIEPVRSFDRNAAEDIFVVYTSKDVRPVPGAMCGAEEAVQLSKSIQQENTTQALACKLTEIALACDFSFVVNQGSVDAATTRMIAVLNLVEGLYSPTPLEIEYKITKIWISSCGTCDPSTWTTTTEAGTLLNNFMSWGNNSGFGSGVVYDVAGLYTKRDIGSGTNKGVIGIAKVGAVCTSSKYHVIEHYTSAIDGIKIDQAHELGHNWNAQHYGTGDNIHIMSPTIGTGNDQWDTQTTNSITSFKNNRTCLGSTCTAAPFAAFSANYLDICAGGTVNFTDQSTETPTSWSWDFGDGQTSTLQNPTHTYANTGTYNVTLTATNATGSDAETKNSFITVHPATAKYGSNQYTEGFETATSIPNADWMVNNIDGGNTWTRTTAAKATGAASVYINNFNVTTNGNVDELISPSIDLSAIPNVTGMTFKIAQAQKTTTSNDKLTISISLNCGASWISRYTKQGANLASAGVKSTAYTPASSADWRQDNVVISGYATSKNVMFRFQFTSGLGNNIYIDDINIMGTTGTGEALKNNPGLHVYPNPAHDNTEISFALNESKNVTVTVHDLLGREVAVVVNEKLGAGQYVYNFSAKKNGLKPGIYFVTINAGGFTYVQKLIIE
jgi:PKD repeat protein